jgi:NAD(P)H dehydrogenase (quinone)
MLAVFGPTGKIGGATVRALLDRGEDVRAIVRDPSRAAGLDGCEIAVADLDDPASIARAVQGADAVQVICPIAPQADDAPAVMRRTVEALAEGLLAAPPRHVLAISDYGAEVEAGTGITMTFHHLEAALGPLPSVTFLRSAEHMQNWGRQIPVALRTGVLGSLHQPLDKRFPTVSAPDVGTIAAGLLAEPADGVRVLHVEGPERYTALDVAATLAELSGRDITARELPRDEWLGALSAALSESYARLVVELFDAHNAGRIDAAGEITRGTTPLRDALAPLVAAAARG